GVGRRGQQPSWGGRALSSPQGVTKFPFVTGTADFHGEQDCFRSPALQREGAPIQHRDRGVPTPFGGGRIRICAGADVCGGDGGQGGWGREGLVFFENPEPAQRGGGHYRSLAPQTPEKPFQE